jgi:hypothetical protein
MDLLEAIPQSKAIIKNGRYAYVKTDKISDVSNYFMVTTDEDEITVITEENKLNTLNVEKLVGYYKLIEFRVAVPFEVVGFLAKIGEIVAKQGLNILIVSTFSKDYILLKEETYEKGIEALKEIGFPIVNEK